MSDTKHDDWVGRVLGVRFGEGGGSGNFDLQAVQAAGEAWRSAIEMVDAQLNKLQAALRADDDEDMRDIAEFGLNGLTAGHKVAVTAALMGAERGNAGDVPKLAAAAERFRKLVENDERIEACDENPFGVAVDIRGQLVPALQQLSALVA